MDRALPRLRGAGVEDPSEQKQIAAIIEQLYRCFVESDAMLCEINPLIVTPDGVVKALDSKFTADDSALYRHPEIAEFRDTSAADPYEAFAREKGVTYVKLDGSVGILGNGAGLSMSTVDVVVVAGGRPANFCDLGGGGSAEGVVDALEVITRDPQVKSIFFNIFGGITRCDEVARGILEALERMTDHGADRRAARRDELGGRAGRSSRTPRRRTCTSRRRCSRPRSSPWSWLHDASLGATGPSCTGRAPSHGGRGPRPDGRVGEPGVDTALDVATGGGHVARRLREAGLQVVTSDPAPGMQPDVICPAEHLPFADGSFDVVACRRAAHHFDDVAGAVRRDGAGQQLARPAAGRDPRQRPDRACRAPSRPVARLALHRGRVARATSQTPGSRSRRPRASSSTSTSSRGSRAPAAKATTAQEVRELLAEETDGDGWNYPHIVFKARKR